jgi:hypothetical protein
MNLIRRRKSHAFSVVPLLLGAAFVGLCLGIVVKAVTPAWADQSWTASNEASPVSFDIAAQPLEAALDVFSSTSNVQVLYETSLTSQRRSPGVHGLLTPGAALNALLAGTGLAAWHTTKDAYSLVSRQDAALSNRSDVASPPSEIARYGHFLGGLQARFLTALCRNLETRPGRYRIALSFLIGPSGNIEQTALVDSTGDPERDARIMASVEGLTVAEAPPPKLAQPITMVIAPRPPDATGDCASVEGTRVIR